MQGDVLLSTKMHPPSPGTRSLWLLLLLFTHFTYSETFSDDLEHSLSETWGFIGFVQIITNLVASNNRLFFSYGLEGRSLSSASLN